MRIKLLACVLCVTCSWGQSLQPQIKGLDRVGAGGGGTPNATTAGSAAGSANLPVFSAGADRTLQYGTRTGNTLRTFTCSAAALTAGKQVTVDASGNCITSIYDVGAAGGSGGNPFSVSVNTGADTVTITVLADVNMQCGAQVLALNATETVTFDTPTGTDDYIIYYNCSTGAFTFSSETLSGVGTADTTSFGVAAVIDPANGLVLPQCSIPISAGSATSNNFDTTVVDLFAGMQAPYCVTSDASIAISITGDNTLELSATGVGGGGGVADPGGNGVMVRTALNTTTARTITGTANEIAVTNGPGTAGNPTIALDSTIDATSKILRIPNSTSPPGTCTTGDIYMDTNNSSGQRLLLCQGSNTWVVQGDGNVGDASTNTATSVDSEVAVFSGTGGKTLKRATGSGLAKLTSGVLSTASAGTDYVGVNSVTGLDASVPRCTKYTVGFASVQTAALTNAVTLFNLPARGKIQGITIKQSTAFAGTSISAVTVSVGQSGGSATAYSATHDIFAAVSNTAFLDDGGHFSATFAAHDVTANFTAVGANLSALNAGSVDIWACTVTLP